MNVSHPAQPTNKLFTAGADEPTMFDDQPLDLLFNDPDDVTGSWIRFLDANGEAQGVEDDKRTMAVAVRCSNLCKTECRLAVDLGHRWYGGNGRSTRASISQNTRNSSRLQHLQPGVSRRCADDMARRIEREDSTTCR